MGRGAEMKAEITARKTRQDGIVCFLGIPAAFVTQTEFWAHLLSGWLAGASIGIAISQGNQVVLNRSEIMGKAKELYKSIPHDDIGPPLLMLDTDVVPRIPLMEALRIYAEDCLAGYDVVLSPTRKFVGSLAREGKDPMMVMADKSGGEFDGREDGPFEVQAGGFGMVLMSPKLVKAIKPVKDREGREITWTYMDNRAKVSKYFDNLTMTEDHEFCYRVRGMGFKVCADTRLLTEHHKAMPVASYAPLVRQKDPGADTADGQFLPQNEGYMAVPELKLLRAYAEGTRDKVKGTILEIGSYKGLSASALTYGGDVVCVDPWEGHHRNMDGTEWDEGDTWPKFVANLKGTGRFDRVKAIRVTSDVFWAEHADKFMPYRLVLIDGSHTYENASLDLKEAWRRLSPGGVVFMDDREWPGPSRAIREHDTDEAWHSVGKLAWKVKA